MENQQPTCSCGRIMKLCADYPDLFAYDARHQRYQLNVGDGHAVIIRYCFVCGAPVFFETKQELDPVVQQEVQALARKLKSAEAVLQLLGEPDVTGEAPLDSDRKRTLIYHNIWPEVSLYLTELKDGSIQFSYAIK